MDFDGVRGHGGRGVHVVGQHFQVELNQLGGCIGMGLGIGNDKGDCVAILEDLFVAKHGAIPSVALVGGESYQTGNAVSPLNILVGDDLDYARHLLGGGGVNSLDVGVSHVGVSDGSVEGVFGKLVGLVVAEVPETASLGNGSGARIACSVNPAVRWRFVLECGFGHFAAQNLGCVHCRVHYGDVTGAAAGVLVLGEPVTHILAGRVRIGVEERLDGYYETRCAETALYGAVVDKSLLNGVEVDGCSDAFGGDDCRPVVNAFHPGHAGAHQLAVNDDITGAAGACSTSDLYASQVELIAQNVGQERFLVDDQMSFDTVYNNHLFNHTSSSFGFV
ncbi:MAG: hypothetical protein A4E69_02151 [Syntrophus sp. PtaB.Bin138]|nr:MAG: hypothetical protein A4E69_02151 [Syntrophus sp. PtaB.Bin138]